MLFLTFPFVSAIAKEDPLKKHIQHIVVIILENHSFNNLFGFFPGAEGIEQAGEKMIQTDKSGIAYKMLPSVMIEEHGKKLVQDHRFPRLPNEPFLIENYIPMHEKAGHLVHRFYQEQQQINGGKMDRFAAIASAGALTMGYYDTSKTALWEYAKRYTLMDHFFHAAFGGSFLNHMWLICACTPRFDNAPSKIVAQLDEKGALLKDGAVTPDGYAVNTIFSVHSPHPKNIPSSQLLPAQTFPTIGDRLSEKHISWAWYAGGWNDAIEGKPDPSFQFHHQPFAYFANFKDGTKAREKHLKDAEDFKAAIKNGTLPAVSFYKPLGKFNLHPSYADVSSGSEHVGDILKQLEQSPLWKHMVVIVTFDENGGYWDHVPPPVVDRFGPGVRVPTLVISPFARKAHVDHTVYDTTSILRFIEERFDLTPLGNRDAQANSLLQALIFH